MKILLDNNVKNAVVSEETNGFSYHKGSIADGRLTQSFPELQKLLLKAVITKEAEEKYPNKSLLDTELDEWEKYRYTQSLKRYTYIEVWQSIIERLPSEEETMLKGRENRECGDAFGFGVYWLKSKLLPSLPSSANCEVEDVEGKIEVKRITI